MNILLIAHSFPPAAGVSTLRATSLAKYLPDSGVRVDVLTARNVPAVGRDASPLAQLSPDGIIHRTSTLDLPFAVRKAIRNLASRKPQPKAAAASTQAGPPAKASGLKRILSNLLLPDPQIGWLPFAFPAAKRVIRKRKIEAVVITVSPFSSLLLVPKLRRAFPNLAIVVDFREEWLASHINLVSFINSDRAKAVAHKTEADAVRLSTTVVCVTRAAVDELRRRYPDQPAEKFQHVSNGFDIPLKEFRPKVMPELPLAEREPTILTYLGSIYGSTDPTPVVEAILALPLEIRSNLRLRFVGQIETPALRETLLRLGDQVELVGFIPQSEALKFIDSTTYLLLITHDPINVSAKLYDYIGSGRPILAAVAATGDAHREIQETSAGWAADIKDQTALQKLFIDAVERAPRLATEFHPDTERIASFHRKPIAAQYAKLLKSITGSSKA